ncbi:MAG: Beta sliding clamp [Chlamydiae bacterium]|nr:Beta sliding clamp [Chlamydiota bacterium]
MTASPLFYYLHPLVNTNFGDPHMKFVIPKENLSELITQIQNIVSHKPTIPILSNFLIEAENGELIITATDLTVGMRCHGDAKVIEEGAITLPAKRFFQLTRELTAPSLEITSSDGETSELKAGTSKFKFHGMHQKDFPALPDLNSAISFEMEQKVLKEMFFRTSFAASREDSRYVLTGILFKIQNKKGLFVGADGKRLAEISTDLLVDDTSESELIFPLKAVEEIYKSLSEKGDVKVFLMPDKIALEIGRTTIVTKLLSGTYPDFKRIIPEKLETKVNLHREELISLLKQVSLFTDEDNQSVRFLFSDGLLSLKANHSSIGEGEVSMPVNYHKEPLAIAFNPHIFLDILRHSRDETIQLGLNDPYNPGIITDQSTARFVIMPMRLNES